MRPPPRHPPTYRHGHLDHGKDEPRRVDGPEHVAAVAVNDNIHLLRRAPQLQEALGHEEGEDGEAMGDGQDGQGPLVSSPGMQFAINQDPPLPLVAEGAEGDLRSKYVGFR